MERLDALMASLNDDSTASLARMLPHLNPEAVSQANAIMKLKRYKLMQKLKKESLPASTAGTGATASLLRAPGANSVVFTGLSVARNGPLKLPKIERHQLDSTSEDSLGGSKRIGKKKRLNEPPLPASSLQQQQAPPAPLGTTANPCNQFHARCIEDVEKCNEPRALRLVVPRELRYVQNLPFLKYTTFGCGKSLHCRWQIETRPVATQANLAHPS